MNANSQKVEHFPIYFETFDTIESWQVYQIKKNPKMLKLCRGVINHADHEFYVEIIPMHINWGEIVQIMLEVDYGISESLKIMKNRQKMKVEYVKYLANNHDLIKYTQVDFQLQQAIDNCFQKERWSKYTRNLKFSVFEENETKGAKTA